MAQRGAIAASDPQTAQAGAAILDAGGNAVDAVLAAAFAAFVVEPPLTSPAGAGALLYTDGTQPPSMLDCMATMPGRGLDGLPDLDFFGVEVDFGPTTQTFHIGRGSAAVPGLVGGLLEAHRRAGSMPLSQLVQPAVTYARSGFVLSTAIQWVHSLLEPIVTRTPGIREVTCIDGALAPAHSTLYNPPLADFLENLGHDAPGALAALDSAILAQFGPGSGGLITPLDLGQPSAVVRPALAIEFGAHTLFTNPPPSSGGGLAALTVRAFQVLDSGSSFLDTTHVLQMARALAAASRARHLGFDAAVQAGDSIDSWLEPSGLRRALGATGVPEHPLGSTTHISVADGKGGAASLTTSNGEGCGTVLEGLGIHMNNFLGEEDINPMGFHALPAGQRMSTMMTPSIVADEHGPRLVLGSGGSNRIRSVVPQVLLNHLHYGVPLDEAVWAPRLHVEGDQLWFESPELPPPSIEALLQAWPDAVEFSSRNMFFGGVHCVARGQQGWRGAGDARRGGAAR